jgi:ABC-type Zn uptake system ZnuABC Zn-binding protein ZnuA
MLAALLLAALAAACGGGNDAVADAASAANRAQAEARSSEPNATPLRVITSVSPITSIAENIGGTKISLEGIVPEGVNSHTFEPAPSVARLLAGADLIILNGLFLEEPMLEMAEANVKEGAVILSLGEKTITREEWRFDFSFPESQGHPNPHLWPDPLLALRYAELIKDELSRLDPANASYYAANYATFKTRIEAFDAAIRAAIATVPEANRKLLTYHDSWAYFAGDYGMQVIGAVQPSDFSEPSAREVADLIDQIKELRLPAIFGSEVFPSPVMEQIAKEGGAQFVDKLRDDDLPGAPGDPRHSYLGLMLTNMEVMVAALGGDVGPLEGLDTGAVFDGQSGAVYPQ